MTNLKKFVLCAFGASATLVACSDGPTDVSNLAENADRSARVEAIVTRDGQLQWTVQHSGPLNPWQQYQFDTFRNAVEDLVSGDADRGTQGALALMEFDPNLYPSVLRTLTSSASPEIQAFVEEAIADYWHQQGQRPLPFGEGGEVTFELKGLIKTLPGSTVGVDIAIWGEETIPIDGVEIPVNVAETAHTCQRLVGSSTNSMKGAVIPISFSLPAYGPFASITVDLKLQVDLTVIIRYYECPEEGEGDVEEQEPGQHRAIG